MEKKKKAMGTLNRKQPKIIVLHGWSYATDKWAPFIKLMEAKDLRLKILAIPGLTAPIDRPWTLDDYVGWLKDKMGREKAVLIGHSNGGRISIAFALKHPALVERLILIDSAGISHNELPVRLKRFIFKASAKVGRKFTSSKKVENIFYKAARANDYKEASPEMRQTMINLISADLTSLLHKINTPTFIIWGARDKITPLSDGELMNKLIAHSRIYVVEEARHSPQFSHPEEVCAKIIDWINDDF